MITGIAIGTVIGLCLAVSKPDLAMFVNLKVRDGWAALKRMLGSTPPL